MGNSLNFANYEDPEGPGEDVEFFRGLKLKQLKSVFAHLQESRISDFDVNNYDEKMTWRQYFSLFSQVKEKMDTEAEVAMKAQWHVATAGYEMTKQVATAEVVEEATIVSTVKDDWTDDDLSEDEGSNSPISNSQDESITKFSTKDENENDADNPSTYSSSYSSSSLSLAKPKNKPKTSNWDPMVTSPIFFGYSTYKTSQKMETEAIEAEKTKIAEERAIATAQQSRVLFIEEFEKAITNQESVRVKKIFDLESKYNEAKEKSLANYERNERDLPEMAFKSFKATWLEETQAAEIAFESESKTMREFNDEKTKYDKSELRKKKEELEAFKDVNKQEIPAAERLEVIARLEIKRWVEEVETSGTELDKARNDFRNIKDEVVEQREVTSKLVNQKRSSAAATKANAEAMRLRSMMNVAATQVKTAQKRLERALEGLADAKTLLHRAVRIYNQQRTFLPLFKLLSDVEENVLPTECTLNLMLSSLIFLMNGTFDQKLNLLFGLYDIKAEGIFTADFIVSILMLSQETLVKMRCIPYAIQRDFVTNAVHRCFFDMQLKPQSDFLTQYETKYVLQTMFSRSSFVTRLLGVFSSEANNSNSNNATNAISHNTQLIMSTYQRNRMHALSLLRNNMITNTVAKYRLHYESTKFRAALDPQQKQLMHERALAMGVDDPLRADYSKFLGDKNKKKSKNIVEPLEHGHLNNITYIEVKKQIDAAIRIQSIFRTRKEIKRAELLARKQAFNEAKEIALREMKEKVMKEFKNRENGTGVGKMKWDAQVRMRQAKARVSGENNYSRSEMVLIMMEETIAKAEQEIRDKFKSIESNEQFIGVEFEKEEKILVDVKDDFNVEAMFGMFFSSTSADDPDVVVDSISTPRPDDDASAAAAAAAGNSKDEEKGEHGDDSHAGAVLQTALSQERTQEIVLAKFVSANDSLSMANSSSKLKRFGNILCHSRGDTQAESEFRQVMAIAEPSTEHLLSRIRALDKATTLIKSAGIMAELPSKRLLLKYVQHQTSPSAGKGSLQALSNELLIHFRIVRNTDSIAHTLKRIMNTDLEFGVLIRSLLSMQEQVEGGVKAVAVKELLDMNAGLREVVTRRLTNNTDPDIVESENLASELDRAEYSVGKHSQLAEELLNSMNTMKERFRKAQLSVMEAEKRRRSLLLLRDYVRKHRNANDSLAQQMQRIEDCTQSVAVTIDDRYSWSKRLQQAMKVSTAIDSKASNTFETNGTGSGNTDSNNEPATTTALVTRQPSETGSVGSSNAAAAAAAGGTTDEENHIMLTKYSEIRNICREFLDIVRSDAIIIISEHKQPKHRKSIPVHSEYMVNGRANECGRGDYSSSVLNNGSNSNNPNSVSGSGKWYTYIAHNIEYKVIEDYDGVYNGSDEYAAKALGGNERRCALEYFKAHIPGLNVPLVATIDFFGFRIIATAKQPTEVVQFTEDGEIRKISEECVHGVLKSGNTFINKGKGAQRLLRMFALKMNLAEHFAKGFNDISASKTWASSDLRVYKGYNEEFYILNCYRSLPSEMTEETPHLPRVPRDQSVFWRQIRPELLKNYEGDPISPDAVSTIVTSTEDRFAQYESSLKLSRHLVNVVIPGCLYALIRRDYTIPIHEGLGIDIAAELHCRGVNVRHLGHMRAMLWRDLPGTINFYFHDQFMRTSKDHRLEVRVGDTLLVEGKTYTVEESDKLKLTAKQIPLNKRYVGESKNRLTARIGFVTTDKNSYELRTLFLAEMVARAVKSIIRLQLRQYASRERVVSMPFKIHLLCEYFNVISGANKNANRILMEPVYECIREKFGPYAVLPSEQRNLQYEIAPCTLYIIKRLQTMLGIRLSLSCVAEFHERPQGFLFNSVDFLEVLPIVRHNIPLLAYSEAVLMSLQAQQAEKEVYVEQILRDEPVVFFKLSERSGARTAENISTILGSKAKISSDRNLVDGQYTHHCNLEQEGPVAYDPFIRSVGFRVETKAWCETKFHPFAVPTNWLQHFSVEVFAKCSSAGGHNSTRTVLMNGRFAVVASRDNHWTFVLMQEMLEVNVRLALVEYDVWVNIVGTFDGTTLRCYFNSLLIATIEVEPVMAAKAVAFEKDIEERKKRLMEEETEERAHLKVSTQKEAELFFTSKAGSAAMKRAAQEILESQHYNTAAGGGDGMQDSDGGGGAAAAASGKPPASSGRAGSPSKDPTSGKEGKGNNLKQRKQEAMRQAKQKYVTDLYVKNVREVALRYKQLETEIEDYRIKCVENGQLRSKKGMRIGAALGSSSLRDGKNFFIGNVSCVSIYTHALSADRIRGHYLAVVGNKTKQAQRLYAETSSKYEEAITFAPDDVLVLKGYAQSLCQYVKVELSSSGAAAASKTNNKAISTGKLKILEAINHFKIRHIPEGIAEIMMALPRDVEFADILCTAFDTIMTVDRLFFAHNHPSMTRKDLVYLPQIYGLDHINNPIEVLRTCASIFQEVVKDVDVRFAYGEVDLGWISDLKSPELVICIVKYANENGNLRLLRVGDMFQKAGKKSISITDEDVETLCTNMLTSVGFDFANCPLLTESSMHSLIRVQSLRVINIDNCSLIDNKALTPLLTVAAELEVLSFAGLVLLTDEGIAPLAAACKSLRLINISHCSQLTTATLFAFAKTNKRLHTVKASASNITDEGLSSLCLHLSSDYVTHLDVSFCRDITDFGIITLSETCPKLKHLNITSNSRITDIGIQRLLSNCWFIEEIHMEDIFLVDDKAFWFNSAFDGRQAANELMLRSLISLNMKDCVNVNDHGIVGLSERCRKIEILVLSGCEKITNEGLSAMAQNVGYQIPMCDSFKSLDLSYCSRINAVGIAQLLPFCGCLEILNLSGITSVDDHFIHQLCLTCKTIQQLTLQKCVQITNLSLCSIADYLWIEKFDITNCGKITDDGIEVLTASCTGLLSLACRKLNKITSRGINAVSRNCSVIEYIDIRDCINVTEQVVSDLRHAHRLTQILSDHSHDKPAAATSSSSTAAGSATTNNNHNNTATTMKGGSRVGNGKGSVAVPSSIAIGNAAATAATDKDKDNLSVASSITMNTGFQKGKISMSASAPKLMTK